MKRYDVITLGEPLIRFEPNNQYDRLERTETLRMALGGAELNVAAALSNVGNLKTGIITKLPDNPIGRWVEHYIDSYKISTDFIVHGGSRVGTYYSEKGSRPRTAAVTYDRENSSFAESRIEDFSKHLKVKTKIFHSTGITLALNENTRNTAIEMFKHFKKNGAFISFDVNFRSNLWTEDEARETITEILPLVDILFISEETCRKMFKKTGEHKEILREFAEKYDISFLASTKREVINQSHHRFSSLVYDHLIDRFFSTIKPYDIEVVDRVGSGDAFIAGFLYGLLRNWHSCSAGEDYGDAFSALKCTIPGDILVSTISEIEKIIEKHSSGNGTDDISR